MIPGFHAPFVLRLAGPVELVRPDGQVITPGAAKLRALLVLIGTGQGMRRPRAFLQDKLWSGSAPERGAASLRQALTSLRRELGPDGDILGADKTSVGLDPKRVSVDLRIDAGFGEAPEFAEGLDVADPEFEDWLRDRRQEFARLSKPALPQKPEPGVAAPRAMIITLAPTCEDVPLRAMAEILTSDIAAQVARNGNAVVQMDPRAAGPSDRLAIQVRAARLGALVRYQVQLIDLGSKTVIWTGDCNCREEEPITHPDLFIDLIAKASFEAARHFGQISPADTLNNARLSYQMLSNFPFQNGERLKRFEHWLAANPDPDAAAVQLAWRARLRLVALLERTSTRPDAAEEAQDFSRRALALDPGNPMVVALAADVSLHLGTQADVTAELARTSVELDPGNPFAAAIYAQALVRCNRSTEGFDMAMRALRLSAGHPNRSWWHAICAGSAMQLGNCELARKHAETAHFQAPSFRPPLRFLSALRFHAGDESGAANALARLKALEPDFSLKRMADDAYPVASMRNTPLMAVTESGLL